MTRKAFTGSLDTMALPDLLQWASRARKTGTLVLRAGSVVKKIHFQGGDIIGSSSTDPRDYLGQVLLSEGLISEQQLKEAMDLQAQTRLMLGRILVQRGLVTEMRMAGVLRYKAEETVYSLFLWTDAEFEFLDGELPPGDLVLISVQVEEVLLEGVRRYDTSAKIRALLPHNRLVLASTGRPLPDDLAAKAFPRRILGLVDGQRTVAEIILEAHSSEYNVCQVLYALVHRGWVAIRSEEAPASGPPPEPAEFPESLLKSARACVNLGEVDEALALLDRARDAGIHGPDVDALVQVTEQAFIERAYRHYLPPDKIPVLRRPLETLVNEQLTPEEVFLVSRVNGSWDLRAIMSISPLREVDALRALTRLRERQVIDLVDPAPQARIA
ncbi:MAG TPA: DUF4388 domain-containing protein [Candidatus Cryosericum sp.]|nr:DUF4388 domain-containing protein [Candidatus Cryosericum sp.]